MTKETRSPKISGKPCSAGNNNVSLLAHTRRIGSRNGGHFKEGQYSVLDLAEATRFVLMITPQTRSTFGEQLEEILAVMRRILEQRPQRAAITIQTIFLREPGDQLECQAILAEHHRSRMPVTNIVIQPPCDGAAVAIEAWAICGNSVRLKSFGPQGVVVSYDGLRWTYCGGITAASRAHGVYDVTTEGFQRMSVLLQKGGSRFARVVRTWLYLGGITEPEQGTLRYQELNRARKDFYAGVPFGDRVAERNGVRWNFPSDTSTLDENPLRARKEAVATGNGSRSLKFYPASTGIGTRGCGLVMSCMTLETEREDVFLLPLENPQQTPAYSYPAFEAAQIPQFSRAIALVVGDYLTTWISGTASIVNSASCYPGDIERQTEQTIDNIQRLIAADNFQRHGLSGAGARLGDPAKVRVYLKRVEDFAKCRNICERRLGGVPAIYLTADICRPELLVEIEGVAFSKCALPNDAPVRSRSFFEI
jgi:enamine deaminase RidA (YjgF/YER057c/UK114 family)